MCAYVALAADGDLRINEQKVTAQIFATNPIHTRLTVLQWAMHYSRQLRRNSTEIVCETLLHLLCCKYSFEYPNDKAADTPTVGEKLFGKKNKKLKKRTQNKGRSVLLMNP